MCRSCPVAHNALASGMNRRRFLAATAAGTAAMWSPTWALAGETASERIRQCGPAAQCTPRIKSCFVRRREAYGMWWPGQIYDGRAAQENDTALIQQAAQKLRFQLDLRPEPIYSLDEMAAWLAEAKDQQVDGLLVVLLDRQQHAWPSASLAIDSSVRTVVFAPIGTAFTTNTVDLAAKTGCLIASTDNFAQVEYGLKMLCAAARLAVTRCIVLAGDQRSETRLPDLGIELRYVPAQDFLNEYQRTPVDEQVRTMATEMIQAARRMLGASPDDVINGIKSYLVAKRILEREEGDAISMDCLGALGQSEVSLPCIAWSRMNDDGIPAACEADQGAIATHCVIQYLFDRPGFQQDPVPETTRDAIIGAHCSCPTRLHGFDCPSEPYDIQHHHGLRDATARTLWTPGQRVTCSDVLLANAQDPTRMLISTGNVLENIAVPPAGGCVVSVMVKFDRAAEVLAFPGFHQLFCYGDYQRELVQFCRLMKIEPVVV